MILPLLQKGFVLLLLISRINATFVGVNCSAEGIKKAQEEIQLHYQDCTDARVGEKKTLKYLVSKYKQLDKQFKSIGKNDVVLETQVKAAQAALFKKIYATGTNIGQVVESMEYADELDLTIFYPEGERFKSSVSNKLERMRMMDLGVLQAYQKNLSDCTSQELFEMMDRWGAFKLFTNDLKRLHHRMITVLEKHIAAWEAYKKSSGWFSKGELINPGTTRVCSKKDLDEMIQQIGQSIKEIEPEAFVFKGQFDQLYHLSKGKLGNDPERDVLDAKLKDAFAGVVDENDAKSKPFDKLVIPPLLVKTTTQLARQFLHSLFVWDIVPLLCTEEKFTKLCQIWRKSKVLLTTMEAYKKGLTVLKTFWKDRMESNVKKALEVQNQSMDQKFNAFIATFNQATKATGLELEAWLKMASEKSAIFINSWKQFEDTLPPDAIKSMDTFLSTNKCLDKNTDLCKVACGEFKKIAKGSEGEIKKLNANNLARCL